MGLQVIVAVLGLGPPNGKSLQEPIIPPLGYQTQNAPSSANPHLKTQTLFQKKRKSLSQFIIHLVAPPI